MNFKQLLKHYYLNLTTFKWVVGIAEYDSEKVLSPKGRLKVHWIKNLPNYSWFADPFILTVDTKIITILVEEFFYSNKKGRISKLVVNRNNWELMHIVPVIDLDTHLSFPAYYRGGGKVYIYPESTKTGKLTLYEYDEITDNAIAIKDICACPLADAVIFDYNGKKEILATTSPKDNGKVLDIYPYGDFPAVSPLRSLSFKTNVARNAGFPFKIGSMFIRPAQDCTNTYGSCVVLQEMIIKNDIMEFKEIRRLYSPRFLYREAFHTFNVFEDRLVAVDAEGFRYGLIAQLVYYLRELFR